MLQVENILCLVSRKTGGGRGLEHAIHLVDVLDATLHAMPARRQHGASDVSLQKIIEDCIGGKPVETVIESDGNNASEAIDTILEYVTEHDVGLVVIDSPPDRGAVPPLADSLRGRLIKRLDCPVFFTQSPDSPSTIDEIVVPTDLSDHSYNALRCAAELAHVYGASISLLYVINTSPYVALTAVDRLSMGNTTLSEHRAYRQLHRFIGQGELPDVPIQPHLAFGDPADRIAHFINEREADLLVLSSHGRQTRSDHPLGQVTDRVLRRVTCPVFFLPSFGRTLVNGDANSNPSSTP